MGEAEFDDGVLFRRAKADDGSLTVLEDLVGLMTAAVVPWLEGEPDELHVKQGMLVAAAAMLAGRTAGHLQGLGVIDRRTAKRLEKNVLINFHGGRKVGMAEVSRAMQGKAS